ncbi:MAG: nuclear transport factor 2 family protein, partial [Planctomycetota bacterium]
ARVAEVEAHAEEARAEASERAREAEQRLIEQVTRRQSQARTSSIMGSDALNERVAEALVEIEAVLDAWHLAAAEGDGPAYFGAFTEDAVFLGTDKTERWTVEEFQAELGHHFDGENAWTYVSTERHVSVGELGMTAWLDERLSNAKYGEVRGSGVLQRTADGWRIAQYVMSFPVPNELATDLVASIAALDGDEAGDEAEDSE